MGEDNVIIHCETYPTKDQECGSYYIWAGVFTSFGVGYPFNVSSTGNIISDRPFKFVKQKSV